MLSFVLLIATSLCCGVAKRVDVAVPDEVIQDRLLTSAVKVRLAAQAMSSEIVVETNHGNVTLSGTVATPAEGNRVIESALSVSGVRSLSPNITVK